MKKIIGLSLIGFLLIGLTTAVLASEHIYPLRDHPEFENYAGTEDFDQWREEMLENHPEECTGEGYGYGYRSQNEEGNMTPGQGLRRGNGLGNGQGNRFGRGMMGHTY
ncbi:hypothetical protein HMI01_28970 [Halolactibacillus miurensis]|uniref:Uncharacterized protein n=1 Tax=Halolactibacillus miurensis TaxID=306541 RepID=A0A1I6PB36_9BACI|nr:MULTISPECIES: hypothetical protein [Halolactibacillus]GEM05909.1 hypothetical protein HMI01_28970 [Halolactibacillus miurensis]SFS37373.1 hypothetical protein SAMN05421668_101317 [Halolactibacillus miurensis]